MRKTVAVQDTIEERTFDMFVLMETWHQGTDDVILCVSCPAVYSIMDEPRPTGRGRGIAYREHFCCTIPVPTSTTSEIVCACLMTSPGSFILLDIYRPV